MRQETRDLLLVTGGVVAAASLIAAWVLGCRVGDVERRVPRASVPGEEERKPAEPTNPGTLIAGSGSPADIAGSWLQFRGADRSNIVRDAPGLARSWSGSRPQAEWKLELAAGHSGAAVHNGRVYIMDYNREKWEDVIRCLSLADGSEIWRYTYGVKVKRNHGMSRTVPAVTDDYVVTIGPKCHVRCLDAASGKEQWKMNMVEDFGTEVPDWYTGQCPLVEGDTVVLAPGAAPLMMRVKLDSGEPVWKTPNPGGWGMTHASIVPMDYNGSRQYVYCTTTGVVGVSAEDGELLWQFPDWRISIATVPSPVIVGDGRIFLSGGYKKGAMMIRLTGTGTDIAVEKVFELEHTVFGAEQQTPILYRDHIYGVIPSGELACLDLQGNRLWTSGKNRRFGLGSYLLVDGLLLCLHGHEGSLHMVQATPEGYRELDQAQPVDGPDAWAPMAMAGGRLVLRDRTDLVCLKMPVAGQEGQ